METRLCASVAAGSPKEMADKASTALSLGADLVELRIDTLSGKDSSDSELKPKLLPLVKRAIITVRSREEGGRFAGSDEERLELIAGLASMNPAYIDIELSTVKKQSGWVKSLPQSVGRIVSWHDFEGTPDSPELIATRDEELRHGAVAKVITTATNVDDNLRTLALHEGKAGRVVAFCMGELGIVSRVLSMRLGAPIAYASLPNEAVAPGQLSISTMRNLRRVVAQR